MCLNVPFAVVVKLFRFYPQLLENPHFVSSFERWFGRDAPLGLVKLHSVGAGLVLVKSDVAQSVSAISTLHGRRYAVALQAHSIGVVKMFA